MTADIQQVVAKQQVTSKHSKHCTHYLNKRPSRHKSRKLSLLNGRPLCLSSSIGAFGPPTASPFGLQCTVGVLAETHWAAVASRVMWPQSANPCVVVCVRLVQSSCVVVVGSCVDIGGSRSCLAHLLGSWRYACSALEAFLDQLMFVRSIARACASSTAPLRVQVHFRDRARDFSRDSWRASPLFRSCAAWLITFSSSMDSTVFVFHASFLVHVIHSVYFLLMSFDSALPSYTPRISNSPRDFLWD